MTDSVARITWQVGDGSFYRVMSDDEIVSCTCGQCVWCQARVGPVKKEEEMAAQYQQGDVFLRGLSIVGNDTFPTDARKLESTEGKFILVRGEKTGHAHTLQDDGKVEVFEDENGTLWLTVKEEGAELTHEEHGPIALAKGSYEVVQQREYIPDRENPDVVVETRPMATWD